MSLVRVARVSFLSALLALTLAVGGILLLMPATPENTATTQLVLPETPYTFKRIFDGGTDILEADLSTFTAQLDPDGDTRVGGIFRVIRKGAEPGSMASAITLAIAACGYNGIVMVRSREYGHDGKLLRDNLTPQILADLQPGTGGAMTYHALCSAGIQPTPPDPGYIAPERYRRFWI